MPESGTAILLFATLKPVKDAAKLEDFSMLESPSLLSYWINERAKVRSFKEILKTPRPWSRDPVFQTTYFTNVHREDDRVTQWIADNWRDCDNVRLVPAMVLARMFNLPAHLGLLNSELPFSAANQAMSKRQRDRGFKLFNGAYLIATCGEKMDKVDYVYRVVEAAHNLLIVHPKDTGPTLESVHRQLTSVNGMGDFLTAQVIADLKNTLGHPLERASDWWTWCAPGPGSLRGIRSIEGFDSTSKRGFGAAAAALHAQVLPNLDVRPMCMQDFQNCLCEFSKYVRVKNGGRSKRNYNGA